MTKLKGLFIDDERYPQDVIWINYPDNIEWTTVRSHYEFSLELAYGDSDYDIYSFDHDIQSYDDQGNELTGYDSLKCLLSTEVMLGRFDKIKVFFHSMNPVGKKNMECYYQNYVKFMQENN